MSSHSQVHEDDFAELDRQIRRLDKEALADLTARIDVSVRLQEVRHRAAGSPVSDASADTPP